MYVLYKFVVDYHTVHSQNLYLSRFLQAKQMYIIPYTALIYSVPVLHITADNSVQILHISNG